MERPKIKRRERDTIIQALRAGVVPRLGLQHIQVGRAREIAEMVRDVERIVEGGAAIRFVIGEYGSGKTFFLNLVRLVALAACRTEVRENGCGRIAMWRGHGIERLS